MAKRQGKGAATSTAAIVEEAVETETERLRTLLHTQTVAIADTEGEAERPGLETREIVLKALDTRQGNVRKRMDPAELSALQASLARYGMLEPVIVQPIPGKHHGFQYRLIAGFRRVAAAQALGWEQVPARVISEPLSGEEVVAVQLTENLQRETMHLRDVIQAIASLQQEGRGIRQVAEVLGLGETTVRWYAHVGEILGRNPRLWPYFDQGLIALNHFRAAGRLMQKARERAGEITQDPVEREKILAQAETVFVAMLERLANTQPLTSKRVSAEVTALLKRAGLADEKPKAASPDKQHIVPAVITGYEHLDVTQLEAPLLERLITVSERQLDAARNQLAKLAE